MPGSVASQTLHLGAATATLLHCGLIEESLAEWLGLTQGDWSDDEAVAFEQPIAVPVQCLLLTLPGRAVLLDACHPELLPLAFTVPTGSPPVPSLLAQLASAGVDPTAVTDVVLSHTHLDHYNGLVPPGSTGGTLTFPQARHYLGRADWEAAQEALGDPASPEAQTLAAVADAGMLTLVEQPLDLGNGLTILPAPGETPGHQLVRLEAGGTTLYYLGDLYHHALEVGHHDWNVTWADAPTNNNSREALVAAALAENALLVATHIAGFGRLRQGEQGLHWHQLQPPR